MDDSRNRLSLRRPTQSIDGRTLIASNGGLFISPGYGFHKTRTLSSYELILVISGEIRLFEETEAYRVPSGHTLLLEPGKKHGAIAPYAPDLRFYWLHFNAATTPNVARPSETDGPPERSVCSVALPKTVHVTRSDRLSELMHRFVSDQELGVLPQSVANRTVALMLYEIAMQASDRSAGSGPRDDRPESGAESIVAAVDKHIELRFREALTVGEIARRMNYHPDYLERVYHQVTGRRIIRAINQRRMDAACHILRTESGMHVTEVAWKCGFRSPTYFHRVFKSFTGLTPRRFRSLYPRLHINTH